MAKDLEERDVPLPDGFHAPVAAAALLGGGAGGRLALVDAARQLWLLDESGSASDRGWHVLRRIDLSSDLTVGKAVSVLAAESYLAVVECRGVRGIVLDHERPAWRLPLARGDYHVKHCTFPLAFWPHPKGMRLIHGIDWNRLQITNLANGQALVGSGKGESESDGDEEAEIDYFHSRLHIAPDGGRFVSNGWCWSPWDNLVAFDSERFLLDRDEGGVCLNQLDVNGYNWDRPCCFVDERTIAFGYDAREAGEDEEQRGTELIYQDVVTRALGPRKPFPHFDKTKEHEVQGVLHYSEHADCFVVCGPETTALIGAEGGVRGRWERPALAAGGSPGYVLFAEQGSVRLVLVR
ncbi:MAG: hypothetical protein AB8H80_10240 [Planctomycetota bacterium]